MAKDKSGNKGGLFPGIKWAYVGISVFLLALGVCALVWPEITAGTVCIAIGIAAILFGIVKLIAYFLREVKGIGLNYDLSIGVLGIAAGIFLLVGKDRVIDLLQIVIGIYLVVDSVFKLQTSVDAKRLGVGGWWVSLILSLACAAFGVVLALRVGSNILMILIGVALIVDGLQNLCLVIFSAMAAKALARMDKDGDGMPDIIDATDMQETTAAPEPAPAAAGEETAEEAEAAPAPAEPVEHKEEKDLEGDDDPW